MGNFEAKSDLSLFYWPDWLIDYVWVVGVPSCNRRFWNPHIFWFFTIPLQKLFFEFLPYTVNSHFQTNYYPGNVRTVLYYFQLQPTPMYMYCQFIPLKCTALLYCHFNLKICTRICTEDYGIIFLYSVHHHILYLSVLFVLV